jgi:uncharacterized protein (DUF4415 family)
MEIEFDPAKEALNRMSANTVKTRDGREFALNTPEGDANIVAAALADPDAQPWTDEQFAKARPASEVMSPALLEAHRQTKNKGGRPKSDDPKIFTGIRLDSDLLAAFKATGKGWQTRVNAALRQYLKEHPLSA